MRMINIFDAVQMADFEKFREFYDGELEITYPGGLNLLSMALSKDGNNEERLKIVDFLIKEGIDINYVDKEGRSALHNFFQLNWRPDYDYAMAVITKLLDAGIDVNLVDKFGSIALIYAITVLKWETEKAAPLYLLLLKAGSDYELKNHQNMSCLDYGHDYSWRHGFIDMVEEFEKNLREDR